MRQEARGALHKHQTRIGPLRGRLLRDQLMGQVIIKIFRLHFSFLDSHFPWPPLGQAWE